MNHELAHLANSLRNDADLVLDRQGLRQILEQYGKVHVSGSYALELMVWRDLDIYLEVPDISEGQFFQLGGEIATRLRPVKMNFRNERLNQTPNLPQGLYWGIYLGNDRDSTWKIDIWAVTPAQCRELIAFSDALKSRLTSSTKDSILHLKSRLWRDPRYRKSFTALDIYRAVLDGGTTDVATFLREFE